MTRLRLSNKLGSIPPATRARSIGPVRTQVTGESHKVEPVPKSTTAVVGPRRPLCCVICGGTRLAGTRCEEVGKLEVDCLDCGDWQSAREAS